MSTESSASFVIPAHNEESVIGRCLASLVAHSSTASSLEVIVVANGCDDRTAAIAREFVDRLPGLHVIERTEPGKIGALNAGDEVATIFPRVYLDADIELGAGAVDDLVTSLDTVEGRVCAPQVHFDLNDSSAVVRAFYRAFLGLPYATDALIGLGVYGLSSSGRARFGTFPDVVADDLFVDRLFGPGERLRSAGTFTVRAPRSVAALLAVRTRVARGNAELAQAGREVAGPLADAVVPPMATARSTQSTVRGLLRLLSHRPLAVGDVLTYVVITAWARRRSRRPAEGWLRDDSTR